MINVFMVDSNESTIKEVKQYFSNHSSICIKNFSNDGLEAIKELKNNKYDVLLLNPIISKIDGIELLKQVNDNNIDTKVIIYSDYYDKSIISSLYQYDIAFYLLKDINKEILEQRIIDATKIKYMSYEFDENKLNKKTTKLLHDLGMPSHIKGYQYIRDAIIMMYNDSSYIGGITKQLYPDIANKYDTTPSRVERAIRHAIEVSWTRGDYDLMDEIFGHSVDFDRAKPTNSEFLATLADKLNLDENIKNTRNYI